MKFWKLSCSVLGVSLLFGCAISPSDLGNQVTIKRDTYGVPHIYAKDTYGLFYGYGYAIATDRLFQMEMAKRIGQGRVAEVLGRDYLPLDEVTHSRFDPKSITTQLSQLSEEDRQIFKGYAAGFTKRVQEVLASPETLLPKEFIDYDFLPTVWQEEDIALVWVGLILNRFFATSSEVANLTLLERLRDTLGEDLGRDLYEQVKWLNDPSAPVIIQSEHQEVRSQTIPTYLSSLSQHTANHLLEKDRLALGDAFINGVPTASNAWVLRAEKTQEGIPVLYNGPQQGWYTPAMTYGVGLHGAGYDLTGLTPVGLPAVLFGTNGKIAWGSTVGSLDTNDVYQLKLNPNNPKEYLYNGKYIPFEHKQVSIPIKGESEKLIDVYKSKQGFVSAFDLESKTAYANRRSWEGLEIETLLGWAEAAKATSWDEFIEQAKRVAVSITWFYADKNNNIGAVGLGRLPIRPEQQHIQFPAVGDGTMEWLGFYDFDHNPKILNPINGYLASWNNKVFSGLLADSAHFSYVDRVQELLVELEAKEKLSQDEIWAIDNKGAWADLHARYFVPYIIQAASKANMPDLFQQVAVELEDWDYKLIPDETKSYYQGAAPAIMRAWLEEMAHLLLSPVLPKDILEGYLSDLYVSNDDPRSAQPALVAKLVWNALQGEKSSVPQTIDLLQGQAASDVALQALKNAVASLIKHHGENIDDWRVPVATMLFSHQSAVRVPWGDKDNEVRIPVYGNTGSSSYMVSLKGGSFTMCSVTAPGQSGFVSPDGVTHPHYKDQVPLFEAYSCKKDPVGEKQIKKAAHSLQKIFY